MTDILPVVNPDDKNQEILPADIEEDPVPADPERPELSHPPKGAPKLKDCR